jgi:thioesterase domain-containing protein
MAARLEAAGHEVAFLGVIDARVFGTDPLNGLPSGRTALEKYALAAELTDGGSGGLENLSAMADEDALSYLLDRAKERGVVAPRIRSATMQRMVNMFAAHERAADRYQANLRVRADIHLFKASARHPYLPSPVVEPASWQEITAGAVHVIHTPGNHHDLLSESHVHSLAGHLGHALANIVERDRRSTHDAQ